ncbi:MAG TPA: FAD-dependent oxidoreductase [Kiritimatiellia bacterium]|nr:FAD-dependent oxidoreductase [Kiritimatiellia bacterium]
MHGKTVILGGGFAGLQACRILARHGGDILLVDPSPVTTMLPALPDLAGGWVPERIVSRPLRELLPAGVDLLPAAATRLDLDQRQIIANGQPVAYDQLLIAAGSVPDFRGTVFPPGSIHALATLSDALRIRNEFAAYLSATPRPQVLVLGTGYTGLELAMSLHFRARAAGRSCAVTLADPAPVLLPSLPARQRQYVLDFLTAQGADIRLGAALDSFDGRRAVVGGRELESPFVCWAGGSTFAVPEIRGGVERLRDGRLVVAPDLSLPGYPGVFAAGDAAAVRHRGQVLRKAVNFAYYGGRHAARNMLRLRRGRPARPFRPVDLGWIVPLHAASIGRLAPGLWIRGRLGVRLHHLMCGLRNYSLRHFAGCLRLALNPNQGACT